MASQPPGRFRVEPGSLSCPLTAFRLNQCRPHASPLQLVNSQKQTTFAVTLLAFPSTLPCLAELLDLCPARAEDFLHFRLAFDTRWPGGVRHLFERAFVRCYAVAWDRMLCCASFCLRGQLRFQIPGLGFRVCYLQFDDRVFPYQIFPDATLAFLATFQTSCSAQEYHPHHGAASYRRQSLDATVRNKWLLRATDLMAWQILFSVLLVLLRRTEPAIKALSSFLQARSDVP